ncbi:RING-H2 finger protein ATL1 [Cajanus cajan]|uniref:RING-type E3 ubiquitin transferase n=1 Tax=Cajanus cajan TaxID=3821 RepID=A0A151RAP5_CAJCA|nr:RING-H2 finger protein ATL1 [Cajanus cajan]KYP39445.1 RING-H2 finger protein ATL1A [Cajanus cajan]
MDFVNQRHLLYMPHANPPPIPHTATHSSLTNFPLIEILLIGMVVSSLFLLLYYMLVLKCCLNWHHGHHARLFSRSWYGAEDPSAPYPTASDSEPRGLEEAVIKLIPVIHYKPEEEGYTEFGERASSECAVCLSEFQQDEKLRVLPNCSHVFHIDCIDVWLHNNAHCPLCRASVSLMTSRVHVVDQVQLLTPRPSPQDQSQNIDENLIDEGFVVIDLDSEHELELEHEQDLQGRQEELTCSISDSSQRRLLEEKIARKLQKVTSLRDECIDIRAKDEGFSVQLAMRRSFSMDSSVDRQFYGAVQQALQQQNGHVNEVNTIEACGGSGRVKRSFFSFGHGSRSRNAVLPVYLDP